MPAAPLRFAVLALLLSVAAAPGVLARDNYFEDERTGTASAAASTGGGLRFDPDRLTLDGAVVGAESEMSLLVNNGTATERRIEGVDFVGAAGGRLVRHDCAPVPAGGTCTLVIGVTPAVRGAFALRLLVRHDGLQRLNAIALTGKAADPGERLASPAPAPVEIEAEEIAFEEAGQRAVLVANRSDTPRRIRAVAVVGGGGAISVDDRGCREAPLAPAARCMLVVAWSGLAMGRADLVIEHDGLGRKALVRVKTPAQPARGAPAQPPLPGAPAAAGAPPPPRGAAASTDGDLRLVGFLGPGRALLMEGGAAVEVRAQGTVTAGGRSWSVRIDAPQRRVVLLSGDSRRVLELQR